MEALYHYSYSFADAVVPELVSRVVGKQVLGDNAYQVPRTARDSLIGKLLDKVQRRLHSRRSRSPRLITLGSVFQFARDGDVVWGTGVNPHFQRPLAAGSQVEIHAVRGPLTRQYIVDELNLPCPEVFGDPGLLIPKLFPEFKRPDKPIHDHLVICQHRDELYVREHHSRFDKYNVYLCQRPERQAWQDVVKEIISSRFVIASSLHALIIAEAFGIPARWWFSDLLPSYYKAGQFKYNDYYLSTGRKPGQFAYSIAEALDMGGIEPISIDLTDPLLAAFPHQLFSS